VANRNRQTDRNKRFLFSTKGNQGIGGIGVHALQS
jgi:hypothetical protein